MKIAALVFWLALGLFNNAEAKPALTQMVTSFTQLRDYEQAPPKGPGRQPIPRPQAMIEVITTAALETDDPVHYLVYLDVLGAHESGYKLSLVGDHGSACGAFQTLCPKTPGFRPCTEQEEADESTCHFGWRFIGGPGTGLAQARVAIAELKKWAAQCDHPLWGYASGACRETPTAHKYMLDVDAELTAASTFVSP